MKNMDHAFQLMEKHLTSELIDEILMLDCLENGEPFYPTLSMDNFKNPGNRRQNEVGHPKLTENQNFITKQVENEVYKSGKSNLMRYFQVPEDMRKAKKLDDLKLISRYLKFAFDLAELKNGPYMLVESEVTEKASGPEYELFDCTQSFEDLFQTFYGASSKLKEGNAEIGYTIGTTKFKDDAQKSPKDVNFVIVTAPSDEKAKESKYAGLEITDVTAIGEEYTDTKVDSGINQIGEEEYTETKVKEFNRYDKKHWSKFAVDDVHNVRKDPKNWEKTKKGWEDGRALAKENPDKPFFESVTDPAYIERRAKRIADTETGYRIKCAIEGLIGTGVGKEYKMNVDYNSAVAA